MPSKSPKKKNKGGASCGAKSAAAKDYEMNKELGSSSRDSIQPVAPHNPVVPIEHNLSTNEAIRTDLNVGADSAGIPKIIQSNDVSNDASDDDQLHESASPGPIESYGSIQDHIEATPVASAGPGDDEDVPIESVGAAEVARESMTIAEASVAVSESPEPEEGSAMTTANEVTELNDLQSSAPAPALSISSSFHESSEMREADVGSTTTVPVTMSAAKEKKLMAYIKQQKLTIRKLELAAAKKAANGSKDLGGNDTATVSAPGDDDANERTNPLPACLVKHPPRWLALRAVSSGLLLPWQRLVGFDSVRLRQGWHAWLTFTQEAAASGDGKAPTKVLTPAQQIEQLTAKNTRLRGLLSRSQNIAGRLREDLESARSGAVEREGRLLAEINALREEKLGLESAIRAAALSSDFAEDYELQLQKAETVALTKRNTKTRVSSFNTRSSSIPWPTTSASSSSLSVRGNPGRLGEQTSSEAQSTLHPAAQPDNHDDDHNDNLGHKYGRERDGLPNLSTAHSTDIPSETEDDEDGMALAYEQSLVLDKLRMERDAAEARAKVLEESLEESCNTLTELERRSKADQERATAAMESHQQERQTLLVAATAAKRKASEATSRCSDLEAELAAVAASQDVVKGGLQDHFQRAADAATQSLRTELTTAQAALASTQLELQEARTSVELAASREATHRNTVEELEDAQDTARALRQALAKAHGGGIVPYGDNAGSNMNLGRSNGTYGSQKNRSESGLGIGPFGIAAGVSATNGTHRSTKGGHNNSHAKDLAVVAVDSQDLKTAASAAAAAAETAAAIKDAKACLEALAKEAIHVITSTDLMRRRQRMGDDIASAQSIINVFLQPLGTGAAQHEIGSEGGDGDGAVRVAAAKLTSTSMTWRADEKGLLPPDVVNQEDADHSARRETLLSQLEQVMDASRALTASAPSPALPATASVADAMHAVLGAATAAGAAATDAAAAAASAVIAADAQNEVKPSAKNGSESLTEDENVLVLASHVRLVPGKSFELPLPVSHPRTLLDWRFEILDPSLSGAEAAAGMSANTTTPSTTASGAADGGPLSEAVSSSRDDSSSSTAVVYGSSGTVGGRLDMTLFRGPAPPPGVDGIEVVRKTPLLRERGPIEDGCGLAVHAGMHTLKLDYTKAGWVSGTPELLLRYSLRLTPLGASFYHNGVPLNNSETTNAETEAAAAAAAAAAATATAAVAVAATDNAIKTTAAAVEKVVVTAEVAVSEARDAATQADAQRKRVETLNQKLAASSEELELWHRSQAERILAQVQGLSSPSLLPTTTTSTAVIAIENTETTLEAVGDSTAVSTERTPEISLSPPPPLTIEKIVGEEEEPKKEDVAIMSAEAEVAAGTEHFVFFDMPTTNSPPSSANENEGFRSMQVEVSWSISSSKPALGFGVAIVCRQSSGLFEQLRPLTMATGASTTAPTKGQIQFTASPSPSSTLADGQLSTTTLATPIQLVSSSSSSSLSSRYAFVLSNAHSWMRGQVLSYRVVVKIHHQPTSASLPLQALPLQQLKPSSHSPRSPRSSRTSNAKQHHKSKGQSGGESAVGVGVGGPMTVFATLYEDVSGSSSSRSKKKQSSNSEGSSSGNGGVDYHRDESGSQSDDDYHDQTSHQHGNGALRRLTNRLVDKLRATAASAPAGVGSGKEGSSSLGAKEASEKDKVKHEQTEATKKGDGRDANAWTRKAARIMSEWQADREKVAAARAALLETCL